MIINVRIQAKKKILKLEILRTCHVISNLWDKNHTAYYPCPCYLRIKNNTFCYFCVLEYLNCHMIMKIEVFHTRFYNFLRSISVIIFMNILSNFKCVYFIKINDLGFFSVLHQRLCLIPKRNVKKNWNFSYKSWFLFQFELWEFQTTTRFGEHSWNSALFFFSNEHQIHDFWP